jgi:hypothetical protein
MGLLVIELQDGVKLPLHFSGLVVVGSVSESVEPFGRELVV